MSKQRVVIALGGKAFHRNGEITVEAQKLATHRIGEAIASLASKYEIIVTHHNGPEVENYVLMQTITNALMRDKRRRDVATIVMQTVVDRGDPAFRHPAQPVGRYYTAAEAVKLAKTKRFEMREEAGRGYRRVVASPRPIDILEKKQIVTLVEAGAIVLAVDNGGAPVTRSKVLKLLREVDAVVDQDVAAEKLAELVKADIFVSVTDVPNAYINYGKRDQIALGLLTKSEANHYIKSEEFSAGSILPKFEAATRFANTRRIGIITNPTHLEDAMRQKSGTIIKG